VEKKEEKDLIMAEQNPFKWRHFQADMILLCVRWYVHYSLSYRDLEEMMWDYFPSRLHGEHFKGMRL
jgi:transposase-like protein